MDSDVSDIQSHHSDNEIDNNLHARLVENILNLSSKQQIKKPSRTEPSLEISEFNLVKSLAGKKGTVHLEDLTKALKKTAGQVDIKKKLRAAEKKAQTLAKPLEKPQADRIRRSVAYKNISEKLNRWEPIITSNRAAATLKFPLEYKDVVEEKKPDKDLFRIKSDLQKKLDELEPKIEVYNVEDEMENKHPLTLKEIMERRKEAAKLRAAQSYKEAKARRQNKIKSKKFHRIQRREKIKQQMKEFEVLQKTDPEAALKKLEEIEKARAEERMSLRHKSTGQWARSKQVRAKYDKESRQVLAQQLAISRELTQKTKSINSESEDEPEIPVAANINKIDDNNPWTKIKTSKEIDDFISGYRKYWENQIKISKTDTLKVIEKNDIKTTNSASNDVKSSDEFDENNDRCEKDKTKVDYEIKKAKINCENTTQVDLAVKNKVKIKESENKNVNQIKKKRKRVKENFSSTIKNDFSKNDENTRKIKKIKKNKKKDKNEVTSTSEWSVSCIEESDEDEKMINKVFKRANAKVNLKLKEKLEKLSVGLGKKNKKVENLVKNKQSGKRIGLDLHVEAKRPILDEPLIEKNYNENVHSTGDNNENEGESENKKKSENNSLLALKSILNSKPHKENQKQDFIDPNKFINTKPTELNTNIPELLTGEDDEDEINQRDVIVEAFEDEDILDEFKKEKKEDINKNKLQDVDLSLPGWGSWGGTDIKVPKRKRKRFIFKVPKVFPRRDDNKGNLIINEKDNENLKKHLVSDLPFPFKTVKDYEASIRAPIGNTFVPETAFRKHITPGVITKLGEIIEPMSEDVLLKTVKN